MSEEIPPEDRITYVQAREITQRSAGYVLKLVNTGRLSRLGGGISHKTYLSRSEIEALALKESV